MRFSKLIGAALLASAIATPASALTFNLISTGAGTAPGTAARAGFDAAAFYWSSVFSDNVTVNLQIGYSTLGPNILASAGSARSLLSMNQTYNALSADRSSTLDNVAVANLRPLKTSAVSPAFGAVDFVGNAINATNNGYLDTATRFDNDRGVNNSTTAITKASAKALGLTTDVNGNAINYNSLDATLTFSDAFSFDFNPRDGIAAQSFDFIGIAIHEIGHALGFVSGVDSYDARTGPGGASATAGTLEGFVVASSLDLFRYSAAGTLDWSTQGVPYFSIDGGANQLFGDSRFSTGSFNGDGRQASHFKDSIAGANQLGVLDPTSARGQMQRVTALDLAAFDAIGWNVNLDVLGNPGYARTTSAIYSQFNGVPEPMTWVLMIGGFGMVGAAARRQRKAVAA